MGTSYLFYLLPYIASMLLSLGIAVYAWQHRQVEGASPFMVVALGQSLWGFGYILELVAPDLEAKLFWDDFQNIGFVMLPIGMTVFALHYTKFSTKNLRRVWIGMSILSCLILVVVLSNRWHGWVHRDEWIELGKPFDAVLYELTPFVWGVVLYDVLAYLTAIFILGKLFFRSRTIYRHQIGVMLIGISVPLLTVGLVSAGIRIAGQRDVTPITFALGNLVVAWALFRYRLFELVPVARDAVVESMDDAVMVLDTDERIIDLNPAAQRLFSNADQLIGKALSEALTNWSTLLNAYQSRGANTRLEVASEDSSQHFELNISLVYDHRSMLRGYLLVLRNVTERVKTRQAIQQQSEELQRQNTELEFAWEAALEADRTKSHFLASMSHELRTPLNAILNFTEFMALGILGPVNEKQVDALQKSLGSGKHLLSLINDILDMTKIEAGMMKLFVEANIHLQSDLAIVIGAVETLIRNKPVQLVIDIDTDLPLMVGDKRRIRQILLNLLSNAAKFTEAGSITFAVKRQPEHLLFMVSDTGPGIAPEDQLLIFEPFKQSEAGICQAGGTGLGLPISKRLVEAHEGEIWLESTVGEGAAFFVKLPIDSPILREKIKSELPEKAAHV